MVMEKLWKINSVFIILKMKEMKGFVNVILVEIGRKK